MTEATNARQTLWEIGVIGAWYLYDYQVPVYEFLRANRFPVFEATRRFGKTTTDLVVACEDLLRNVGFIWRWCEPWKDQARKIVMPEMEHIHDSCPTHLKPKFYRTDSFYEYPSTGSRLYLVGLNEDRGESARGQFANGITIDEKGSLKDPDYIINEVLLPQLLTTQGVMHELSTPPRNLGHAWYTDKERALKENRFIQRTINDVSVIPEPEKKQMCEAVGGPSSAAWRREFLCEAVADPELQIVPEYKEDLVTLPGDYKRPEFFDAYVGGDSGADDNTAILFGYYDFMRDWLVIEAEYVQAGRTTEEDIKAAKEIEGRIWASNCTCKKPCYEHATRPYRRVLDAQKKNLIDVISTHQYSVYAPEKDDKHTAIKKLRRRIQEGKLKIDASCRVLKHQLRVGMWKDDRHSDFERSEHEDIKHLDALAAAVYLNRSISTRRNPYPEHMGLSHQTHFIPDRQGSLQPEERLLSELFGR